jgi:ribosomal protein L37AE/L43A
MKIILSEKQAERIFKDKVTCDKCENSWDVENNSKHPYLCHDCGWDNKKKNYNQKELFNFWKKELTKKEIDEKWSEKYEKSINCNNPKGFSQRAHCQGKKKNKL